MLDKNARVISFLSFHGRAHDTNGYSKLGKNRMQIARLLGTLASVSHLFKKSFSLEVYGASRLDASWSENACLGSKSIAAVGPECSVDIEI
jgi:hypothetical protein